MTKQRWHLYASENVVFGTNASAGIEAAQGYVDWITRTKWWRQHSPVRHVRLKYPVFGKMSGITMDGKVAVIELGPFSLTQETILHELGHVLDYHASQTDEKDHNAKFAGILLAIIRRYMTAGEAEDLRKAFDERDVKYAEYE